MDRKKLRQFAGAFLVTVVIIGAMCGFLVVDLSTDRYMPGRIGPMFLIESIHAGGVALSFMGEDYLLDTSPLGQGEERPAALQGLLPWPVQLGSYLGEWLHELLD